MNRTLEQVQDDVQKLLADHRHQCLWFMREDHVPRTAAEMLRALDQIQRHGTLDAFRRAGEIKQWLLRSSSGKSAV